MDRAAYCNNKEKSEVVKEIFNMYTEDLIGANKIANS